MKNLIVLIVGIMTGLIIIEIILRAHNLLPAVVKGDKIILRANSKVVYNNEKNKSGS